MGEALVPGPADQGAGQQRDRAGREAEAVPRAGEEGCAEEVAEAREGEDDTPQQAAEQAHLPRVVDRAVGLRVAALDPLVELLGQGEGVLHAVALADLVVGQAVGLQQRGDLVRVDGGGDEVVEAFGEFVEGVGLRPAGCGALARDGGQGVGAGAGRHPDASAHQPVPSVATFSYQGSRSSRVQSATVSSVGSYTSVLPASSW